MPDGSDTTTSHLLAAIQHGGPAVIIALVLAAGLAAFIVYRLPELARPLAAAFQMVRGGRSEREGELEQQVAELRAENTELRSRLRILEDRAEEVCRALVALADHLVDRLAKTGSGEADISLVEMVRSLALSVARPADHTEHPERPEHPEQKAA